jgi:hypothetical protein
MEEPMIRYPSSRSPNELIDGSSALRTRVLIVDGDNDRARKFGEALEIAGYPEPERALSGDDALDILGARAQQFDIVAVWAPLPDYGVVDFAGVLRRCRSPVRLAIITDLSPRDFPQPNRLAGTCAVEGRSGERGVVRCLKAVAQHGTSVGDIVATRHVPSKLDQVWALAIYGAPPGARVSVPLD